VREGGSETRRRWKCVEPGRRCRTFFGLIHSQAAILAANVQTALAGGCAGDCIAQR
jgi:hypothetical protein